MVSKEHHADGDENLIINAINISESDKFVICALVELSRERSASSFACVRNVCLGLPEFENQHTRSGAYLSD